MECMKRFVLGKLDPCYDVNPVLWRMFCAITDRPLHTVSFNWTEQDVINFIMRRAMGSHDTGRNEKHSDTDRNIQTGPGNNC